MREEDVPQVTALLAEYLKKFSLSVHFDEADVKHWIFPHKDVVESYVVEDPETNKVTDLCSFYHLPSTVLGHAVHKEVRAAYSYYNVATATPLVQLMSDALILAKKSGVDVMNCLDLMENKQFIEPLKFGAGDGNLHYYLYNWKCPLMPSGQVGLVLL
jgi:glycylpeptide N-tetradecanoyltransferase